MTLCFGGSPVEPGERAHTGCRDLREVRRDALGCQGSRVDASLLGVGVKCRRPHSRPAACAEAIPTTVAPQPAGRVSEPSLGASLGGALGGLSPAWLLGCRLGLWGVGGVRGHPRPSVGAPQNLALCRGT